MPKIDSDYIAVGKIIGLHGNQGWVKILVYSDVPDRFKNVRILYIDFESDFEGKVISDQKFNAKGLLLKFRGIIRREEARELVGKELYLPEREKVELSEDYFFIHDLLGLDVFDEKGNYFGLVDEVLKMGANEIYIVKNKGKEILIPANEEFVKKVDIACRKMIVRLWEGM
jgi:16S rRNA processing protein RimM